MTDAQFKVLELTLKKVMEIERRLDIMENMYRDSRVPPYDYVKNYPVESDALRGISY